MNEILKFDCEYYEKYNTKRINIENGVLNLNEHCKVLRVCSGSKKVVAISFAK